MTMTPWEFIKAGLIDKGLMDERSLSRRARARTCRSCHAKTIAGFDAETCARVVEVDPHPLTALGEALAQISGRYTCALHRGGRPELDTRTAGRIALSPAGASARCDVLAEHRCGDRGLEPFACPSVFAPAALDLTPGLPAPY